MYKGKNIQTLKKKRKKEKKKRKRKKRESKKDFKIWRIQNEWLEYIPTDVGKEEAEFYKMKGRNWRKEETNVNAIKSLLEINSRIKIKLN